MRLRCNLTSTRHPLRALHMLCVVAAAALAACGSDGGAASRSGTSSAGGDVSKSATAAARADSVPAGALAIPPDVPRLDASSGASAARPAAPNVATASDTTRPKRDTTAKKLTDSARYADVWARVKYPPLLPGAILPNKRIVAYYGNLNSKKMGILGEVPLDQVMSRLDQQAKEWEKTDPARPVVRALHLVTVVAQGQPGEDGMYRRREATNIIEKVYAAAKAKGAITILDIQVGMSDVKTELDRLLPYLQRPDVHFGIDPEFDMYDGIVPGKRVGVTSAADVNYAIRTLAELVTKHNLPPKVLVVHRFKRKMLPDVENIKLDPRVQVVINMDGWGAPHLKRATWRQYILPFPVQFTGFKLFYHNDTKKGDPLMKPADVLKLWPKPVYIQYQ